MILLSNVLYHLEPESPRLRPDAIPGYILESGLSFAKKLHQDLSKMASKYTSSRLSWDAGFSITVGGVDGAC